MTYRHILAGVSALVLSVAPPVSLLAPLSESVMGPDKVIPLPPMEFQGDAVATQVFFVDQEKIDILCGGQSDIIACANIGGGAMALPNPCQSKFRGQQYADLVCHEKGHTSGWSHDR